MYIHHCTTIHRDDRVKIKLFFLENPFAKGQLKSWYDFFLKYVNCMHMLAY